MNQGWTYRDRISPATAGQTLLAYYVTRYRHSSEADWRSRIESCQIWVEGRAAIASDILQAGQTLTYKRPPWEEPTVPLTFEILYEDRDLVVVAKPSGLPVMPGGGFLEHTLLGQLQRRFSGPVSRPVSRQEVSRQVSNAPAADGRGEGPSLHSPSESAPVPIHRLGRGTSGLVLLGRSPLAKSVLTGQMRDRKICKIYRALASGSDLPEQFTVQTPIGKIPHPSLGHIFAATPSGRFAQSNCRVLRRDPETTLVEVEILTGRPHQIRIHLAAAGSPLVGDPLYLAGGQPRLEPDATGRWPLPGDCGYHLHAFRLGFAHPRSGQPLTIESQPPEILRA